MDVAISTIQEYIQTKINLSQNNKYETYRYWAAYELMNTIMDHPCVSPLGVIENFELKSEYFASIAKSCDSAFVFHAAANVAHDIGLLLI